MPLRDFKCVKCGAVSEHLVRPTEPAPPKCEEPCPEIACDDVCEGQLELVEGVAATSFRTVGGGWFKTGGY